LISAFYTYLWLREDGTPYYVGKGSGRRAFTSYSHRVKCPKDTARILVQEFPDESAAFAAEKFLIAFYGRRDLGTGILRNLTDGGEGASGVIQTEETRVRKGIATKKRYEINPALREISRALGKSQKGKPKSAIARLKMSKSAKRRPPISEETRRKISRNASNPSAETRQKMSIAHKGRDVTKTTKKNIESGHLLRISYLGARIGNHVRWHVQKNIVKPTCSLCVGVSNE
jgi:hypothetical protein